SNVGGQKPALNGESKPAEISPSPNSTALADPTQQVAPLSSRDTGSTLSSSLPNSGSPNSDTSTGESKGFSFDSLSRFWQSSPGLFVLKYWRWILAAVLLLIALLLLLLRGRKAMHEQEVEAREEIVLSDQRPLPAAAPQVSPVDVYPNSQAAEIVAAVASKNSSRAEILESPRLVEKESSVDVEKELPLVVEKVLPIVVQKPEPLVVPRPLPTNFERAEEEVRHLLMGNEYDTSIVDSTDPGMRQFVATELLSAMGGRHAERRALAIAAFEKHCYFDEATHTLRVADAQAERASSARALGLVRDTVATPHLVAALEDSSPDVRRAAVEALAEIRDPSAVEPLSQLLQRERDRKVPRTLIQRAIDASSNIVEEQPALPPPPSMEEMLPEIPGISALVPQTSASETVEEYELAFASSTPVTREISELTLEEGTSHKSHLGAEVATSGIIVAALDGGPLSPGRERHSNNVPQNLREHNHFKSIESNELIESQNSEADLKQPGALSDVPDILTIEGPEAVHDRSVAEHSTDVPPVETFELVQAASNLHEAIKTETVVKAASPVFTGTVHLPEVPASNGETAYSAISLDQVPLVSADDFLKQVRVRKRNEWIDVDVNQSDQLQHQESVKETLTPSVLEEEPELLSELPVGDSTPVREINTDETSIEQFLSSSASSGEVLDIADLVSSLGRTTSPASINEKEIIPLLDVPEPENPIRARLFSKDPAERAAAVIDLGRTEGESGFQDICKAFDDAAPEVRNAAAQTLYELNPDRTGSFTRALREAPIDRRRRIGSSLAGSGLAAEAIGHLTGEGREKTYDAYSLLFLMSKAGEVQPLVRAIEDHPSSEVRLTVVKLLALSGQHEILPYFRRLAVRGSLPSEVRSAVMEAIYQISNQGTADAHTAA
ncbi:MAG: hypothetical protein QOH96_311, partial [Blastocatellia bacterium]|nr:hypothetical protein [Blastocatellia bacterium]